MPEAPDNVLQIISHWRPFGSQGKGPDVALYADGAIVITLADGVGKIAFDKDGNISASPGPGLEITGFENPLPPTEIAQAGGSASVGTDGGIDISPAPGLPFTVGGEPLVPLTMLQIPLGTARIADGGAQQAAPDGTEQDSGIDLPAMGVLYFAHLQIASEEITGATKTFSAGLSTLEGGTGTELLSGAVVSAQGILPGTFPFALDASLVARRVTTQAASSDWVEFGGYLWLLCLDLTSD